MAAQQEIVATFEEANEAGYWGVKPDPRPNDDYTVAGAIARKDELFAEPVAPVKA